MLGGRVSLVGVGVKCRRIEDGVGVGGRAGSAHRVFSCALMAVLSCR